MVRVVLGAHSGGVQVALDDRSSVCAPCSVVAEPVPVEDLAQRVIVRHRTRIEINDDGVPLYGWSTAYDGPGIWSAVAVVEDDDAAGMATETATVTVPTLEGGLETTAHVWDHEQHQWTVTATVVAAGSVALTVTRRVDADYDA